MKLPCGKWGGGGVPIGLVLVRFFLYQAKNWDKAQCGTSLSGAPRAAAYCPNSLNALHHRHPTGGRVEPTCTDPGAGQGGRNLSSCYVTTDDFPGPSLRDVGAPNSSDHNVTIKRYQAGVASKHPAETGKFSGGRTEC